MFLARTRVLFAGFVACLVYHVVTTTLLLGDIHKKVDSLTAGFATLNGLAGPNNYTMNDNMTRIEEIDMGTQKENATRKESIPTPGPTQEPTPGPTIKEDDIIKNETAMSVPESVAHKDERDERPKNAIVFLLGGVDLRDKTSYKGFLYNILVSKYILQQAGSQADVVMLLQWTLDSKFNNGTLPEEDWRVLNEMNIRVNILPRPENDFGRSKFARIQMEKFRFPWKMVEYERVLYLDSDQTPLCNVDYMFDLSKGPDAIIKPNMVFPGQKVPSNGGIFMLEPNLKDHEALQELMKKRFAKEKFDPDTGWGTKINASTPWRNWNGIIGTKWDYYAAAFDQGLLYHWMRYENGTFSSAFPMIDGNDFGKMPNGTIVEARIENWSNGELQNTIQVHNFSQFSCLPRHWNKKNLRFLKRPWSKRGWINFPFHSDFIHWMASAKPWNSRAPEAGSRVDKFYAKSGLDYWFYVLGEVEKSYNYTINWDEFGTLWRRQQFKLKE